MIDAVAAERLVRLRVLLAGALAAATDQTATGRHVSVIFLDGVAELSLHLAADELGVNVLPRHGLEDVYANVAGALGSAWDRKAWKGVRELHRARNNLQHHGVLPDAQHLPLWAADIDQFLHSLISAAYGSDLGSVRAADAVEDAELREKLTDAEQAIDIEDFTGALGHARRSLGVAVGRFRGLTGGSSASRFSFGTFDELRTLDRALGAVEGFVDIAYLATDPAEWLWLERIHGLSRSQPIAREDAQRAYSFALAWILRFEAFEARLPRRVEPDFVEASLDEDYSMPTIVSAEVREEGDIETSVLIRVGLGQTPPNWLANLHSGIRSAQESGEAPTGTWARGEGRAIVVRLPEELDGDQIRPLVHAVIAHTHLVYEGQLQARRDKKAAEEGLAARYADVLLADARVKAVQAEQWAEGRSPVVRVTLQDSGAQSLNQYQIEAVLNERRPVQTHLHIGFRDGVFSFGEDQYTPDEALAAFDAAVSDAKNRASKLDAREQEADERRRRLLESALAAFADVATTNK
jgi:hypothetical protein